MLDSFVSIDNSVSNRETRSLSGKPLRCCMCVCGGGEANNEPLEKRMILNYYCALRSTHLNRKLNEDNKE